MTTGRELGQLVPSAEPGRAGAEGVLQASAQVTPGRPPLTMQLRLVNWQERELMNRE